MSYLPGVALVVAVTLAALAALVLLLGRGTGLHGRGARLARMGRLSAALSASWLGATVRRSFARGDRRVRIDEARRRSEAAAIARTMGEMKGAFMKLGQLVSFVSDDIPPEYRAALQTLQAEAPPMDFPLLRDVAERELARPLERAFASFDERPLAAASIGQVHRARLPSGEEVVVKIQYPGVAEAIRHDLDNFAALYQMTTLLYPALDPKPVVEELRERLAEELDYSAEAASQRAFADLYEDHPFIRVPRVYSSHSTARVLTSEYTPGKRYAEIALLDQPARGRYGEILYRFVFGSLLRFGVFNGDPHPGNYLFDDAGRVVFLDYGCVKYFPPLMLRDWTALVSSHLRGERDRFRAQLARLGFLRGEESVDRDLIYDYFGYFYEPFEADRPFTFTREYNSRSFGVIFKPSGRFEGMSRKLNMPRDFVFANRIQWGVYSLLATLGATANWHKIDAEWRSGGPPHTALGEAEHEHRRKWQETRGLAGKHLLLRRDGLVERAPWESPT